MNEPMPSNLPASRRSWLFLLRRGLSHLPPSRKALVVTLVSLTAWMAWSAVRRVSHPWADMSNGVYTDHFSHMNTTRVFPRIGRDLWRKSISEQFRTLTDEEMKQLPSDVQVGASSTGGVYFVPGWNKDKPLATSWSHKSRMYPPGDLVLASPIAALYHYTKISFKNTNRLLIVWFLVLAHVSLFCFFLLHFEGQRSGIEWLGLFFIYSYMMRWTLEGFYDAATMGPLILSARYLGQRRGLAALVAYCVAAFIHFRAFFLAPWSVYALFIIVKDRQWRTWTRRDIPAMALALAFAVVSLYVFYLDLPHLKSSWSNNPLLSSSSDSNPALTWTFKVILGGALVFLLGARAWGDALVLAWLGLIMFSLREFYWWHILVPMAWIAAPTRRELVRGVRIAFFVTVTTLVLKETLAPTWLQNLYRPG